MIRSSKKKHGPIRKQRSKPGPVGKVVATQRIRRFADAIVMSQEMERAKALDLIRIRDLAYDALRDHREDLPVAQLAEILLALTIHLGAPPIVASKPRRR